MNSNFKWWKPWTWFTRQDHTQLRQMSKTLNALNFAELGVVFFFSYICWETIYFVMEQVSSGNNHTVLAVLATGVTVPIAGLVFGMLKNINATFSNKDKEE